MFTNMPLFPKDCQNEKEHLGNVYRILGIPNRQIIERYSLYFPTELQSEEKSLKDLIPINILFKQNHISFNAIQLLDDLLKYDPIKRISSSKALEHPYFSPIDRFSMN